MKFSIFQNSRKGARKSNQDRVAYSYSRDALLMVVADGMGGHMRGDIAAQITVEHLTEAFQKQASSRLDDPFGFLQDSIQNAHRAIHDFADKHSLLETPRTTCVASIIQDDNAYWAHVGDSRLYFFRNGKLMLKTRDHSRVQQLIDQQVISEDQIGMHPERNKIYNCLGGMFYPEVELSRKVKIQQGDTFLLCTDGLWGPFSDDEITLIISVTPIMEAVKQLMEQAEFRGGAQGDNISLIGMTWGDEALPSEQQSVSTITMPINTFTTQIVTAGADEHGDIDVDITDEEIETAIAEIHSAINKFPK